MSVLTKVGAIIVKNSPKICLALGVAGVGIGVGIACSDTLAGAEEIEQAKEELNNKEYIPAVKRFAKVYWPSVVVIGGSLVVIIGGHYILAKRYAGLVVAYESLNKSYKNYRGYIKKNYGDAVDFNARHESDNVELIDNEVIAVNPKDIFIPDRDLSDYAVLFGKGYSLHIDGHNDDPETVFNILRSTEEWANAVFQEQGYIYLQDVYEGLGLIDKFAPDGVGWCAGIGDDYVDFGIFSVKNGDAINQLEPMYWLDFNVDGYILPYI